MYQTSSFKSVSLVVLMVASIVFGMILAGVLDLGSNGNAEPTLQQTLTQPPSGVNNLADVADIVSPAVVAITSTQIRKNQPHSFMDPDIFRWFFGPQQDPRYEGEPEEEDKVQAGGSGFIISPDGYIVTNNHVIEDADEVEVTLNEEGADPIKAEVIGADPATDLALLKIKADKSLPYLVLGDSDSLRVGEWVMAAGYPLRYGYTVTVGVVSAKGKRIGITDTSFENFIQTDAAINFGNSGGPLLNSHGQVVGINTAIAARGQNIGFAVPVSQFKRIEAQLKKHGKVVRGYLGVRIRDVDHDIQEAFRLKERKGAFVEQVESGTPAEEAGVKHGDVILKVDEIEVKKTTDLINYVSSMEPDSTVTLTVWRDGKTRTLKAKLSERSSDESKAEEEKPSKGSSSTQEKLGITVRQLTPELRRYYRLDEDVTGLLITNVKRVSPAADEGLRQGDVILEINGEPAEKAEDLEKVIQDTKKGDLVNLYMLRPGRQAISFFAIIRIDE